MIILPACLPACLLPALECHGTASQLKPTHHPPTYQPHKSTTAGAQERTQGVAVMACRFNAKREKRKRNGENARKYRMKVRETRQKG